MNELDTGAQLAALLREVARHAEEQNVDTILSDNELIDLSMRVFGPLVLSRDVVSEVVDLLTRWNSTRTPAPLSNDFVKPIRLGSPEEQPSPERLQVWGYTVSLSTLVLRETGESYQTDWIFIGVKNLRMDDSCLYSPTVERTDNLYVFRDADNTLSFEAVDGSVSRVRGDHTTPPPLDWPDPLNPRHQ